MIRILLTLLLLALDTSRSVSGARLHGIVIKNRNLVYSSNEHLFGPPRISCTITPPGERMLTETEAVAKCAEFAAAHQDSHFALTLSRYAGSNTLSTNCLVYSTVDYVRYTYGHHESMIAICPPMSKCTSGKVFRVRENHIYTNGGLWRWSADNLTKTECLDYVVAMNVGRARDDLLRRVQWSQTADGFTVCAVLSDIVGSLLEQTSYIGWIASEKGGHLQFTDLSCSSPFVEADDINDCKSLVWTAKDHKETLWTKFSHWRQSFTVEMPDYPKSYRPPPPILANSSYLPHSLEYYNLVVRQKARLDTAAFGANVRVIEGPQYVPQEHIKALTATDAIKECAARAQRKMFRSFSLVQRWGGWECSMIWEELESVSKLMIKDDEALWSFIYSASLNSTLN